MTQPKQSESLSVFHIEDRNPKADTDGDVFGLRRPPPLILILAQPQSQRLYPQAADVFFQK